jgi:ribonuclease E
LEAAEEIARQLKLRDLAGLIVIDFIDMEERRNNRKVENRLKDALRHDRARIQVGRISHFGLLEMSRQRLRTGVLEGSTSQCPHCQGTGIIRSVESVALAVLRALEDQCLRDARHSLIAVTTAEVALYILNNKRSFVTEMERRYGMTITVQASDRMQGANFAIEKAAAVQAAPQRAQERAVVNMEWGFEGQEADEPAAEVAEESEGEREGARRGRRRRRRGRRDDRPEASSGEPAAFARNGEGDDAGADHAPDEERGQPFEDEPLDEPAGFGEQPALGRGEDDREGGRGRGRRRRGRRGGRRGRDRDAPRQPDDRVAEEGYQGAPNGAVQHDDDVQPAGNGGRQAWPEEAPAAEPPRQLEEAVAEAPPAYKAREPEPRPAGRSWAADTQDTAGQGAAEAPASVSPSVVAEAPAPVHEPEPEREDPSKPVRKGWWQRKFSGS